MKIPVFHDDHMACDHRLGAVQNALALAGKKIGKVKIVTSGAGRRRSPVSPARYIGCQRENIWVTDLEGVVYEGREKLMDRWKSIYAQNTKHRTLMDVIDGAIFSLAFSRQCRAAGNVQAHWQEAVDPRARQPDAGDHAGIGAPSAPRRDDLHRPLGLSQSGE